MNEDVSPIENGDFPLPCGSFQGGKSMTRLDKNASLLHNVFCGSKRCIFSCEDDNLDGNVQSS